MIGAPMIGALMIGALMIGALMIGAPIIVSPVWDWFESPILFAVFTAQNLGSF